MGFLRLITLFVFCLSCLDWFFFLRHSKRPDRCLFKWAPSYIVPLHLFVPCRFDFWYFFQEGECQPTTSGNEICKKYIHLADSPSIHFPELYSDRAEAHFQTVWFVNMSYRRLPILRCWPCFCRIRIGRHMQKLPSWFMRLLRTGIYNNRVGIDGSDKIWTMRCINVFQ